MDVSEVEQELACQNDHSSAQQVAPRTRPQWRGTAPCRTGGVSRVSGGGVADCCCPEEDDAAFSLSAEGPAASAEPAGHRVGRRPPGHALRSEIRTPQQQHPAGSDGRAEPQGSVGTTPQGSGVSSASTRFRWSAAHARVCVCVCVCLRW